MTTVLYVAPNPFGGAQCNIYAIDDASPTADIAHLYRTQPARFAHCGLMRADYRLQRLKLVWLSDRYKAHRADVDEMGAGSTLRVSQ